MDFVTDVLQSNRKFRVFNVIDDSDRVAVAQKVAHSIPASRLIRFMEEIIWENGKPNNIRCDNGPEFISHEFQNWCEGNGIEILYTQPGCPTQNSYFERFNGSYLSYKTTLLQWNIGWQELGDFVYFKPVLQMGS